MIPNGRNVLHWSKRDWLVRERSTMLYVFLFRKATAFHLVSENALQLTR